MNIFFLIRNRIWFQTY